MGGGGGFIKNTGLGVPGRPTPSGRRPRSPLAGSGAGVGPSTVWSLTPVTFLGKEVALTGRVSERLTWWTALLGEERVLSQEEVDTGGNTFKARNG